MGVEWVDGMKLAGFVAAFSWVIFFFALFFFFFLFSGSENEKVSPSVFEGKRKEEVVEGRKERGGGKEGRKRVAGFFWK